MDVFIEKKKLLGLTDSQLIEEYGRRAARLRILEVKIEVAKNKFKFEPKPEDDVAEFVFQPIEEEREILTQQILQIDSELRRRRTP